MALLATVAGGLFALLHQSIGVINFRLPRGQSEAQQTTIIRMRKVVKIITTIHSDFLPLESTDLRLQSFNVQAESVP